MKPRPLRSVPDTEALGRELASWLSGQPGAVIYLSGPLGSGKTTLVRGALRALGITGPIRSPTYTLLEPYQVGERQLIHLDLYRLKSADEVEQLGLRDYPPERSWWLVEWPTQGEGYLPPPTVSIELQHDGASRLATVQGLPGQS